jgi:hypothetical protein
MITKLVIRLLLFLVFLTGCSFPSGGKTTEGVTPSPEKVLERITPSVQPSLTVEVTTTDTTVPQYTLTPTNTPELAAALSPTPYPEVWYLIQPGTPWGTFNTPHQAAGCSWLGVGGQVFGTDAAPVLGLSVLVGGTLDGYQVGSLGTTGMETNIGEGGYEVTLADHPVDSSGTLWIQVVDTIGKPLSDKIFFDTYNDCDRNFILINFISYLPPLHPGMSQPVYFPIISDSSNFLSTPIP